jgi:adenylate cyclase
LKVEQPQLHVQGATERPLILTGLDSWTIGRSAENAFAFNDVAMSRRHALVEQLQPGKFYLVDLGSSNGSSVNGQRITTAVELHDGDSITCGNTTLIFRQPAIEKTAAAVDDGATMILYQKRLITVLVIDIRSFTRMTRQIDEELLAQTMGTWFRELGSVFDQNGCKIDKYIGDAAMAVWVHENQIPDQKQICRVLETLLVIQRFTSGLHERFNLPAPLRIGAGINTGISVLGNTGSQGNPDFSPLGDSVNAAFRLESVTKETGFDIAIGALAFECVAGATNFEKYFEKRLVELKGYQQPQETWLTSYAKLEEFLSEVKKRADA